MADPVLKISRLQDKSRPTYVIKAGKLSRLWSIKELWKYKDVFFRFAQRDMKLRYRQTILGVFWTVVQPLMSVGIFSIFFGSFAKIPSNDIPYPLFVYSAILPWGFFANCLSRASASLVGNAHLLTKVYFPRILIPLSCLVTPIVDFIIGLCVLIPAAILWGYFPSFLSLFSIIGLIFLTVLFAFSIGLWLSAIYVHIRDIGNILGFILQLWMFSTPVIYPQNIINAKYQFLYNLNPMVGIITSFRSAITGTPWQIESLFIAIFITLLFLIPGLFFFRYSENVLADVV